MYIRNTYEKSDVRICDIQNYKTKFLKLQIINCITSINVINNYIKCILYKNKFKK